MRGYKTFDKNLKCRDMQYEVGKEYEMDDEPILLVKGFHFCQNPRYLSRYYNLKSSRICEIEAMGEIESDSKKSVTNHIKVKRELSGKEILSLTESKNKRR